MADDSKKKKQLRAEARAEGYRLVKPGKYIKFCVFVHEETLRQFKQAAEKLNYDLKDAATEAIDQWLDDK